MPFQFNFHKEVKRTIYNTEYEIIGSQKYSLRVYNHNYFEICKNGIKRQDFIIHFSSSNSYYRSRLSFLFLMRSTFLITLAAIATAVSAAPAALDKRATKAQVISTCTVPGTIALTFDDGPYEYTWALAETLKKAGITATFFMNGHNWV